MNTLPTHAPPQAGAADLVVILSLFTLSLLPRMQGWQMGDACGVQLVCKHMWAKEREEERGAVSEAILAFEPTCT